MASAECAPHLEASADAGYGVDQCTAGSASQSSSSFSPRSSAKKKQKLHGSADGAIHDACVAWARKSFAKADRSACVSAVFAFAAYRSSFLPNRTVSQADFSAIMNTEFGDPECPRCNSSALVRSFFPFLVLPTLERAVASKERRFKIYTGLRIVDPKGPFPPLVQCAGMCTNDGQWDPEATKHSLLAALK
jgi:hypothetical protein